MFIPPALEELTDNTSMSGQRAVPSSIHDPPSVEDSAADSPSTGGKAPGSQDIDFFQQELSRQLTSVDPQKFQQVKQAIQSAVQNYGDSADLQSVIQVLFRLRSFKLRGRLQTTHFPLTERNVVLNSAQANLATCHYLHGCLPRLSGYAVFTCMLFACRMPSAVCSRS